MHTCDCLPTAFAVTLVVNLACVPTGALSGAVSVPATLVHRHGGALEHRDGKARPHKVAILIDLLIIGLSEKKRLRFKFDRCLRAGLPWQTILEHECTLDS